MHQIQKDTLPEIRDVTIGYIGGGSQNWTHTLINDLLQCEDISGRVALYDIDHESAAANAELGNELGAREEAVGDWTFKAHRELEEALAGADFVVCSIQDPPEETFVHDIDLPQEYGIYQPVGDTVGPGGIVRSLRVVPQYREIAATIREQCPDAWVVNYTNPMTVCTRTLYKEYPEINAIGLCHEVFKPQKLFADLAEKHVETAEDIDSDEIDVTVKGVNHFTWVDEAYWRDYDLFGYLDAELEERKPLGEYDPADLEGTTYYVNNFEVAFDLYDRFGLLGAAGDRHLVEFVPWYLDIDDPEEIRRWGIRMTPSHSRVEDNEESTQTERYRSGEETFEFTNSGEEAVEIMRALLGIEPVKTHVNYPNIGQCPDLRDSAVVETNALITGDDVSPITAGPLPPQVRSMVSTHVTNQETVIEAGVEGDLDLGFQAFLNDPLVTIDRTEAADLFARLIEIEREYFADYDIEGATVISEGPPEISDASINPKT